MRVISVPVGGDAPEGAVFLAVAYYEETWNPHELRNHVRRMPYALFLVENNEVAVEGEPDTAGSPR